MPLTSKGEEIKSAMQKEYGSAKGESVFYASKNKGTVSGVDADPPIPADYATKLDAVDRAMVRLGSRMDALCARRGDASFANTGSSKFSSAKLEGYKAQKAGKKFEENPWIGPKEKKQWEQGYKHAENEKNDSDVEAERRGTVIRGRRELPR